MADLVKCKTCNAAVAKMAPVCPSCGIELPGIAIKCRKCKSSNITAGKKGFGLGKAAVGGILLGPVGLLGGMIGRKKLELCCVDCGYKWKPESYEMT